MTFHKCIAVQLLIIFTNVLIARTKDDIFYSRVNFNVEGKGFHRTVRYQVETKEITDNDCHIALVLELPSTLYINTNELSDLQKFDNTTACVAGETDVELFAEDAESQQITMCAPKIALNKFTLIIHERYQRATYNDTYVNVTLSKPRLLFGCKQRIKNYSVSPIDLCEPCVKLALKWREVPFDTKTENYTWIIPVGNVSQRSYITHITLFISLMGTFFILRALWHSHTSEHTKND